MCVRVYSSLLQLACFAMSVRLMECMGMAISLTFAPFPDAKDHFQSMAFQDGTISLTI